MKIRMTKAMVLDALHGEVLGRLAPHSWVTGDRDETPDPTCKRCATGSVLLTVLSPALSVSLIRKAADQAVGFNSTPPPRTDYIAFAANRAKENPLSGLSNFFEGHATKIAAHFGVYAHMLDEQQTKKLLDDTIEFVWHYFPDEFVVDIDGAKPRDGIEIVEE